MHPRIYVGMPRGDRKVDIGSAVGWLNCTRINDVLHRHTQGGFTFSTQWAEALNLRAQGVEKHGMIHSDVDPDSDTFWLDQYNQVLTERKAKIISAVIAMKDSTDTSSTGYARRVGKLNVKKLTLQETDRLPPVFTIKDVRPHDWKDYYLCLNTGLWLADIRGSWADKIQWVSQGGFRPMIKDGRHVHIKDKNGVEWPQYEAWLHSEDWLESRVIADMLDPEEILATKNPIVGHWGWFRIINRSTRGIKCRLCLDSGLVDDGSNTVACPECQVTCSPPPSQSLPA
jgi:hypothetical protein